MSDRKIKNISDMSAPLFVYVKSDSSNEHIMVALASGEEFWTTSDQETNSIAVYKRKGLIEVTIEGKPSGADYEVPYPIGSFDILGETEAETEEELDIVAEKQPHVTPEKEPEPAKEAAKDVEKEEVEPTNNNSDDGISRSEWADEDVEFLKQNYPTKGVPYCMEHLNRSKSSVKRKIEALGLKKKKKNAEV